MLLLSGIRRGYIRSSGLGQSRLLRGGGGRGSGRWGSRRGSLLGRGVLLMVQEVVFVFVWKGGCVCGQEIGTS